MFRKLALLLTATLVAAGIFLSPAATIVAASSQLTIRPNAVGDETALNRYPNSGEASWQDVDDITADEASTYVYTPVGAWYRDLYGLGTTSQAGTINYVRVYVRCVVVGGGSSGYVKTVVKTNGTGYESSGNELTTSWTDYYTQYNTNPQAGGAWTWAQVNALQAGVSLIAYGDSEARCTQVYVTVDYTLDAPTVTTQAASGLQATQVTGNGSITGTGGENASTRGFKYGLTEVDTWDVHENGSFGTGAYTLTISSLTAGAQYYCRAYATNSVGTGYGSYVSFYTLPGDPSGLTATPVAASQINLSWTKGTNGDKTMVRFRTDAYPTSYSDGSQAYFDTASSYNHTGLPAGTPHYYRVWAYDTDSGYYSSSYSQATATTYGPSVSSSAATLVEETTATLNGSITATNDGNASIRGFDWDIDTGAPYASNWNESGSFGTGTFTHSMTSLTKGELYYFRAYATNTYGTGYGSELTLLTKPDEPTSLDAVQNGSSANLTWTKGSGAQNTYIRRKDGSYPTNKTDGTLVYNSTGTSCNDAGLSSGYTYYYRAWSYVTEGGLEQYSDTYSQDYVTIELGLVLWFQPNTMISGTTLPNRQSSSHNGTIVWGSNPSGVTALLGALTGQAVSSVGTSRTTSGADIAGTTSGGNVGAVKGTGTTGIWSPIGALVQSLVDQYNASGGKGTVQQAWMVIGLVIVMVAAIAAVALRSMFVILVGVLASMVLLCAVDVFDWWVLYVTMILMGGMWVLTLHRSGGMT